jgi:hypothetical protein
VLEARCRRVPRSLWEIAVMLNGLNEDFYSRNSGQRTLREVGWWRRALDRTVIASLIETCKPNSVGPRVRLTGSATEVGQPNSRIDELLRALVPLRQLDLVERAPPDRPLPQRCACRTRFRV